MISYSVHVFNKKKKKKKEGRWYSYTDDEEFSNSAQKHKRCLQIFLKTKKRNHKGESCSDGLKGFLAPR